LSGGDFHFALAFDNINEECSVDRQPYLTAPARKRRSGGVLVTRNQFSCAAASFEADGDWQALLGVAQEWTTLDATNSTAWLALWRALSALKRERDADLALLRAAALVDR